MTRRRLRCPVWMVAIAILSNFISPPYAMAAATDLYGYSEPPERAHVADLSAFRHDRENDAFLAVNILLAAVVTPRFSDRAPASPVTAA